MGRACVIYAMFDNLSITVAQIIELILSDVCQQWSVPAVNYKAAQSSWQLKTAYKRVLVCSWNMNNMKVYAQRRMRMCICFAWHIFEQLKGFMAAGWYGWWKPQVLRMEKAFARYKHTGTNAHLCKWIVYLLYMCTEKWEKSMKDTVWIVILQILFVKVINQWRTPRHVQGNYLKNSFQ